MCNAFVLTREDGSYGCSAPLRLDEGAFVHTNRLITGFAMVAIGLALVGVAILLGG